MATDTNNSTSNNTSGEGSVSPSASECIPWLVVLITECLAIVILNIITIIVFMKQRQLQRRSTYLIIHLAIVDLLVGAVSGPMYFVGKITSCSQSEYHPSIAFILLFQFISIMNLTAISLERMHATFRPLQHRLLSNWHYGVMIFLMWCISILIESIPFVLYGTLKWNLKSLALFYYIYFSINLLFLLVISVSYISILVKVRYRPRLYHHGAANREQKLTTTLFIVTLVSSLTWLPGLIFFYINTSSYFGNYVKISLQSRIRTGFVLTTLTTANSLVNPILYAVRIAEFRTVLR